MKRPSRGIVAIDVVSAILIAVAIALYVWPVRISAPPAPGVAVNLALPSMPIAVASGDEVTSIVASNIMSASRQAPASRYVSPDRMGQPEFTMPAAFLPTPDPATANAESEEDAIPSLYGIVNIEGTSRALLRLSESDASPVLLREGDKRGAYRVVTIRANAVIVAGPSGQRTLHLSKSARSDSTGKQL